MNSQSQDTKKFISLVLILSGLAMMIGPFVIPQAANLEPMIRMVIVFFGFMDLMTGLVLFVIWERER